MSLSDDLKEARLHCGSCACSNCTRVTRILDAVEEMKEGLEFYADANYSGAISQENLEQASKRIYSDRGHRARTILERWK